MQIVSLSISIAILISFTAPLFAEVRAVTHQSGGLKGIVELRGGELLSARWQRKPSGSSIIAVRSVDHGTTWTDFATVLTAPPGTDVGDGNLIITGDNQILLCYRYNRHTAGKAGSYSIAVHQSADGGMTWRPHSTVATSTADNPRGLWAPFLFQGLDGQLLCFYDDEQTPQQDGLDHQQYVAAKRWDAALKQWVDRRTVCRAHNPHDLSRDGMATVVQLPDGRLLATLESIRRNPPHTNVIRSVTSDDNGKTWDWQTAEAPIVYRPNDASHLAVSPWVIALRSGRLACFFATDEDQWHPVRPGSSPSTFRADIKVVYSVDGRTWSTPSIVYADDHRSYMPGAVELLDGSVLVQALDYGRSPSRVQVSIKE